MAKTWFDEKEARAHWAVTMGGMSAGQVGELRVIGRRSFWPTTEDEFIRALVRCGPGCLCTLSVNPRRSAGSGKDEDVAIVRNLVIDMEPDNARGEAASEAQRERCRALVFDRILPWCDATGIAKPVVGDSGNGVHLVFAIPDTDVARFSDIKTKAAAFREKLVCENETSIREAGVRVDHTFDLSRVLKVYGTAKPLPGHRVACFMGAPERCPDARLVALLQSLDASARVSTAVSRKIVIPPGDLREEDIPERFWSLLDEHPRLRLAWNGKLDDITDRTRSGQDLSLVGQLVRLGIVDPLSLARILYNAPHGKARDATSSRGYVERTIAVAFDGLPPGLAPGSGLDDALGDPDYLNPALDFRDGIAFIGRRYIAMVEKAGKEGPIKVPLEVTKLVTSDRRVLPIDEERGALSRVAGGDYFVAKANVGGSSRWRLRKGAHSVIRFIRGDAPRVSIPALFAWLTVRFERIVDLPDRDDYVLCALYVAEADSGVLGRARCHRGSGTSFAPSRGRFLRREEPRALGQEADPRIAPR
jgi:hypothetical protein